MPVEVYSSVKPAARYRARALAVVFLLAACALAWAMSARRADHPLRNRINLPGWEVGFATPPGFTPGDPVLTELGPAIPFYRREAGGRLAECAVWRVATGPDADAESIAGRILQAHRSFGMSLRGLLGGEPPVVERMLGPFQAAEVAEPPDQPRVVVRAAQVNNETAVAVSLAVENGVVDDDLYGTFDTLCRSVQPSD